jgi:hypothetical protein
MFLRCQLYRKLMDGQLGPCVVLKTSGANIYKLGLPSSVHLHYVFHLNNLRPCPSARLPHYELVSTPENDDDEYGLDHISVVKIVTVLGRRGKYAVLYPFQRRADSTCLATFK